MSEAHFIYIADVYCPWCYGFGPVIRRISKEHPEFPIKVIGGDLMSTPTDLQAYAARDPGLRDFWLKVQKTTGRNLGGAIDALERGLKIRMDSPRADEILTVLKRKAPGHELDQMLELEDMFYDQGKDLFTDESLAQIGERWDLSPEDLKAAMAEPENREETRLSLALAAKLMGEITAYPSLLLVRGKQVDVASRGYVRYETADQRVLDVMRDLGVESEAGEYCSWSGNCAFGARKK